MSTPTVQVGDAVLYTPHLCHALEKDHKGEHLFEFEHVKDGPIRQGRPSVLKGQPADMSQVGDVSRREAATGHIETWGGHVLKPTKPRSAWQAVVVAAHEDGTLDLEIRHPYGHTLGYPHVPYSSKGALHSWRPLEGE